MQHYLDDFKSKNLVDILDPLDKAQRDFLALRLAGVGVREAGRIVGRKENAISVWRCAVDPYFKAVEQYVLANKEQYLSTATKIYLDDLGIKARIILNNLIEMGMDWEKIKSKDKYFVMKAIELTIRLQSTVSIHKRETYEEVLGRLKERV